MNTSSVITYKDTHDFSEAELQRLFLSANRRYCNRRGVIRESVRMIKQCIDLFKENKYNYANIF